VKFRIPSLRFGILNPDKSVTYTDDPVLAMSTKRKDGIVAKTQIGKYLVSTVFLGLDHGWEGDPLWFETMVFNTGGATPWLDLGMHRYRTYDEAVVGHASMVKEVENARFS
jgi:hypothetical protein